MMLPWEVLVISSDIESRRALVTILSRHGLDPICSSTIDESRDILAKERVGLVYCDRDLADGSYRDLLSASDHTNSKVRVVVTYRRTNWDENLEAMRLGAFDLIAAPCMEHDVEWTLLQASRDAQRVSRGL